MPVTPTPIVVLHSSSDTFGQSARDFLADRALHFQQQRRNSREFHFRFIAIADHARHEIPRTSRQRSSAARRRRPPVHDSAAAIVACFIARSMPDDFFQRLFGSGKDEFFQLLLDLLAQFLNQPFRFFLDFFRERSAGLRPVRALARIVVSGFLYLRDRSGAIRASSNDSGRPAVRKTRRAMAVPARHLVQAGACTILSNMGFSSDGGPGSRSTWFFSVVNPQAGRRAVVVFQNVGSGRESSACRALLAGISTPRALNRLLQLPRISSFRTSCRCSTRATTFLRDVVFGRAQSADGDAGSGFGPGEPRTACSR